MAFQARNLSVLAYANGFTLWHYTTVDPATGVDTAGYFNAATEMLREGDMILANVDTDGTTGAGVFIVRANTGGAVDVTNLTPFGAANTD
jgi:hypothetical protein